MAIFVVKFVDLIVVIKRTNLDAVVDFRDYVLPDINYWSRLYFSVRVAKLTIPLVAISCILVEKCCRNALAKTIRLICP